MDFNARVLISGGIKDNCARSERLQGNAVVSKTTVIAIAGASAWVRVFASTVYQELVAELVVTALRF